MVSKTWVLRKQEENAMSIIERSIERVMLGVSCIEEEIRSSVLCQLSKIRDEIEFAMESKIRWPLHVNNTRDVSNWVAPDTIHTTARLATYSILFVSYKKRETTWRRSHAIGTNRSRTARANRERAGVKVIKVSKVMC
ncbi:hypothetical protein RB195_025378 [Necator americanus]|uniref:Uncharacterized protein n=1 Tax=Necator americanus TaxID=51031 RepID=A0ABR1ES44_NECAM